MILRAIDIWIVKELVWYVTVVITFLLIMIDQGDNMIINAIAGGVITFVLLYWWRTTQSDHVEAIRPKESTEEMKRRDLDIVKRRKELEVKEWADEEGRQ